MEHLLGRDRAFADRLRNLGVQKVVVEIDFGGVCLIIVPLVERLRDSADFDARTRAIDAFNADHETLKKGIALMPVKFGISFNTPKLNQAGALVHVYADGSVHLNHGGTEMGQGLFTKVAQVVASLFEIDIDNVKISATRTDKVPNTSAAAGRTAPRARARTRFAGGSSRASLQPVR